MHDYLNIKHNARMIKIMLCIIILAFYYFAGKAREVGQTIK